MAPRVQAGRHPQPCVHVQPHAGQPFDLVEAVHYDPADGRPELPVRLVVAVQHPVLCGNAGRLGHRHLAARRAQDAQARTEGQAGHRHGREGLQRVQAPGPIGAELNGSSE